MEKNRVYRLNLNDYLYIEILYDGNEIYLVSSGNTPKNTISFSTTRRTTIIKIANIPKCTINLENGKIHTKLKIIPTSVIKNYSEILNTKSNDEEFLYNHLQFSKVTNDSTIQNQMELHTHFMEILSGEQYLQLVLRHLKYIGLDVKGDLCRSYPINNHDPRILDESLVYNWISKEDIYNNRELYNNLVKQLSLPTNKQVDFFEINKVLEKRIALLNLIGFFDVKKQIENIDVPKNELKNAIAKLRSDAKAEIYVEILLDSLETLKNQGIKYVEMSYSTYSTIIKIHKKIQNLKIEGIKFNFLLSENRNALGQTFREYYHDIGTNSIRRNKNSVEVNLEKLIKLGYVKGFDLMGMEHQILKSDYEKDSIGNSSLYDKLSPILKVLNSFNDNSLVCRLHAGEIKYEFNDLEDKSNPERILEIIDKIVKDNNMTVPPPSIRLGHGLNIQKNDNYLSLLKKYKVIIEINASSNFALGNIKDMRQIPYRWYFENNIPMVLGTDGGGFYLTTPLDEVKLAEFFGGEDVAKGIHLTDELEVKRRGL